MGMGLRRMANSRCAQGVRARRIWRIFLRALRPVADGAEDVPAAARVSALHEHRFVGFDACPSALLGAFG